MQEKSVMRNQFHCGNIHWSRDWLSVVVLIALVNCLTVLTSLALPPPTATFDGEIEYPNSGFIFPQTTGAVSRNFVLTAVNGLVHFPGGPPAAPAILIQHKDGQFVGEWDYDAWWYYAGQPALFPFDPVVVFDPHTNRWFFVMMDLRSGAPYTVLYVGASKTDNPSNPLDWQAYYFDNPIQFPNGDLDHPKVGFNGKWLVVQTEDFAFGSVFSAVYVFDKGPLLDGTFGPDDFKVIEVPANKGIYMCPARTYDPTADEFLLQSTRSAGPQPNDTLTYYRISGDSAANATLSQGTDVVVHDLKWNSAPPDAPQRNTNEKIAHDDDRIHSCIYRNGSLWAAQSVGLPELTPTISAVQWWQIDVSETSPKIVQRGRVGAPSGDGNFRAFPSLAVNANENVLIGYAFFSSYLYPSGAYSFRFGTDPPGTLQVGEGYCGVGQGPWKPMGDTAPYLWGDSSAAVIDPIDDRTMWTVQEFSGPVLTMTPTPVTTTRDSKTVTAPVDTFSEAHVGAAISGPGIPSGSVISAFHDSSSVELTSAAWVSDTVEATISPDAPNPFRLWATHWISISRNFGRFVAGLGHSIGQGSGETGVTTALAASGLSDYGQLGNNSTTSANHPVSAGGSLDSFQLYNIMDVAAGFHSSLAVDNNGAVFVWGANIAGQLGDGTWDWSPHSTPVAVPCAPSLPCSGGKFNIFKPDGTGQPYHVPVSTGFGISPSLVSFKLDACAAVDYLGQVWMWGYNWHGELGDGTTTPHYTPGLVRYPTHVPFAFAGVASVETGDDMTIALKRDGTVWAWGSGCFGALGDGDTSCPADSHIRTYPQQVLIGLNTPLTNVVQVACGRASDFCLALTRDETVYGWGANGSYQLGLNDTVDRGYATLIPNLTGVRRIAAGGYHSLALVPSQNGRVYAWGQNGYGQCGTGSLTSLHYPTPMGGTNNSAFTDIAAGNNFSLMIRGSAQPTPQVWGTGDNIYGQLATGNNTPYTLPTLTQY